MTDDPTSNININSLNILSGCLVYKIIGRVSIRVGVSHGIYKNLLRRAMFVLAAAAASPGTVLVISIITADITLIWLY